MPKEEKIVIEIIPYAYVVPQRKDAKIFFGADIHIPSSLLPGPYRMTGSMSEAQLREHIDDIIRRIKANKKEDNENAKV